MKFDPNAGCVIPVEAIKRYRRRVSVRTYIRRNPYRRSTNNSVILVFALTALCSYLIGKDSRTRNCGD